MTFSYEWLMVNAVRHANQTSFKKGHKRSLGSIEAQKKKIKELVANGRWVTQVPAVAEKLRVPNPLKSNPGSKNGRWLPVGSKRISIGGYIKVKISEPNVWEYEHRVVAESKIGRPLKRGEHVHHLNCDKSDNREENIVVMSHSDHASLPKNRNAHPICPTCGYRHPPH